MLIFTLVPPWSVYKTIARLCFRISFVRTRRQMSAKIIIIGAGAAGIAAATRLYEKGFKNLQILEATERIGGRVATVDFGKNVVEMGAQWVHGQKNNVVYELAGPLGLLESSVVGRNNIYIQSSGEIVPTEISDRLMSLADGIVGSEEFASYNGTMGDFVTARFTEAMQEEQMQDIDPVLAQQFLVFFHNYVRGYNAFDSWYNISASGFADYELSEGDQNLSWMGKGFKSALDLLMKRHPAQNDEPIPIDTKILFNKFVTNINWNKGPDNPLTVSCSDGTKYDANHVILTTSLGVLKDNITTVFTPELPTIKQNAIKGIYFGAINKIFMEFKTPFWRDLGNTFGLLWDANELEELRTTEYAWTEGLSLFITIDRQPNLLAAWMIGKEGRQSELLDDEQIIDGLMFILRKFFKSKNVEKPASILRSKWSTDPNFRGTYSSSSLFAEQLGTGPGDLALPLTDCLGTPALLFAGEATNTGRFGTVHGAVESGWREADRVVEFYEKQKGTSK
ncbi:spermine oxidase-like [Toxorhynchites rutilus septentrionalis]|uniref:spermine oxidase-like n=1 Tax=Toxorhynchites rutilus septentrionalis TaxID=329112 RepID=UPI00247937E0|nr:spermine oxidase-like [Toxorhynchites rutilus septentrionalis]